jgi:hypothetical protein
MVIKIYHNQTNACRYFTIVWEHNLETWQGHEEQKTYQMTELTLLAIAGFLPMRTS